MIYQLLDSGLDTARKALEAGVDAIEQALIASPKREESSTDSKRSKANTRLISEEERKYWRRIAESIYKTLQDEFEHEVGEAHASVTSQSQHQGTTLKGDSAKTDPDTASPVADVLSAQPKPDNTTA
jgi:N utilization substance protein A